MYSLLQRALERQQRKLARRDAGFTLIELLVVITILGILAAIVVFSVSGIGDKGQKAAAQTDASILRTAEEAYFAKNSSYGTVDDLINGGFLASGNRPTYNAISVAPDKKSFEVVPPTCPNFTTGTPRILGASNVTLVFQDIAKCFVAAGNAPVSFQFGSSSSLVTTANTAGNTTDILFASADEANVNATISNTVTGLPGQGTQGTCTAGANCSGIGSTKTQYTNGRLVLFSCKNAAFTLAAADGTSGTNCPAPTTTGSFEPGGETLANIVSQLQASGATKKLVIANPGTLPPSTATPPNAPYGVAAYQALTAPTASGGGGLDLTGFNNLVSAGRIIFGSNVTATQTAVRNGSANWALIPKSFVVAPGPDDANSWQTIASSLHSPIRQWAVVLDNQGASGQALGQAFLNYLLSSAGVQWLTSYGYDPVS